MSNEELRQLAMAATPGPWNLGLTSDEIRMVLGNDDYICHAQIYQTPRSCGLWQEPQRIANATYIAAANPAAVLALLDENARLKIALYHILAGMAGVCAGHAGGGGGSGGGAVARTGGGGGSGFAHNPPISSEGKKALMGLVDIAKTALEEKP